MKHIMQTVQRIWSFVPLVALVVALALLAISSNTASAVTLYGTLGNFDVINDTGQECHGFEIELDGLSKTDVTYSFGAPYERYGDPTVVDDPANNRVFVRYTSSYDPNGNPKWAATTPMAPSPTTPTLGHQCWTGGDPVNYPTSGCEHFGVSLIGNPTTTVYRWLVEGSPGVLVPLGTNVNLPAPIWNVTPAPTPAAPPVVKAAIAPPAPRGGDQFGDAQWVKVFVTELPNELHPDDLVHLILDDPAMDIVPNEPVEIEIEWQLLQSAGAANNNGEQEFGGQVGAGNEAVSRRFEFYKYVGDYDTETHEALCDNQAKCPEAVGDFIGAQNAAVNLVVPVNGTETPTDTPTDTPTATPTATPTQTPTDTPTQTTPRCVGDCNDNSKVSIDEILTLVNIALENLLPPACPHGVPASGKVDIVVILQAVSNALADCPSSTGTISNGFQ